MLINDITQTTNVKFPNVSLSLSVRGHTYFVVLHYSFCVCRVSLSLFHCRNVMAKCFGRGSFSSSRSTRKFPLAVPIETVPLPSSIFKLLFFVEASPILISYHLITCVIYPDLCFFFFILLVVVFFISFVFSKKESFHRTFFLISTLFWTRTLKSVSPPNSIISICELCA